MPSPSPPADGRGVDYERAGERYHRSRGATVDLDAYRDRVHGALTGAPPGPVLDVGAGTGAWSAALASWSGRPVVAIEPAADMRAGARAATPPHVHLVGGRADHLPSRAGAAGAAWLSTVIHHVGDLGTCARELGRALGPGAPVLIRSAFPGRYDGIPLVGFFPPARRVLDRFPSLEAVRAAFCAGAGFGFVGVDRVDERPAELRRWRERLPDLRAVDTPLVALTDDEFAEGVRAVDAALAAGTTHVGVGLDLVVLRSPT